MAILPSDLGARAPVASGPRRNTVPTRVALAAIPLSATPIQDQALAHSGPMSEEILRSGPALVLVPRSTVPTQVAPASDA